MNVIEGMGSGLAAQASHALAVSAMASWSIADKLGYLGILVAVWCLLWFVKDLPDD